MQLAALCQTAHLQLMQFLTASLTASNVLAVCCIYAVPSLSALLCPVLLYSALLGL